MTTRSTSTKKQSPEVIFISGKKQPIGAVIKSVKTGNAYIYVITDCSKKAVETCIDQIQGFEIIKRTIRLQPGKVYGIPEHTVYKYFDQRIEVEDEETSSWKDFEKTEHLHTLAANFPSGSITLFDAKLNVLFSGGEAYIELKVDPQSLIGLNAKDFLPKLQYNLLVDAQKKVVSANSHTYESIFENRSYQSTLKPIYGEQGKFQYYVLTAVDNTSLKEQQNKVLLEKNRFAAISNALNRSALVLTTDENGLITDVNDAFCKASKYLKNELIGKSYNIVNSEFHGGNFWKEMWDTVSQGKTWRSEVKSRSKDGDFFWVDSVINPIYNIDGVITGYLAILYLISERKELEFNLLQITNKFVLASQAAGIGVWTMDLDSKEVSWDIQIDGISELGFFKGGFEQWLEFVHPTDRDEVDETINSQLLEKGEFNLELRLLSNDKKLHYINLKASTEEREEQSKRAIGLTWDITREKSIQQNLEEALADRETMFKELHHRIKNNLQMVNSLLYIRGTYTQDEELKEFIKDTGTKINSISTIHEKLLQLSPMNQINIDEYLTTLCNNVVRIYSDSRFPFNLQIDILTELFDVDTALNLGLILNEILSNSIKYAYPDTGGLLKVSLKKKKEIFILEASDEGVGFATDKKNSAKASYGIQLIELFVRQIDGQMQVSHKQGTSYTIKFQKR